MPPPPSLALSESAAVGRLALPAMQQLPQKIPKLAAAMLCSADGLNLCSIGLDEDSVHRIAAIASTLIAMSTSAIKEFASGAHSESLDMLSLCAPPLQIIGVKVALRAQPDLVLLLAARHSMLGALISGARSTAAEIQALLENGLHTAR